MKTGSILPAIFLAAALSASCGNSNGAKNSAIDTGGGKKKHDTAIVTGNQTNVPNDSVSGDPSAKGAADPNARLPKK